MELKALLFVSAVDSVVNQSLTKFREVLFFRWKSQKVVQGSGGVNVLQLQFKCVCVGILKWHPIKQSIYKPASSPHHPQGVTL